MLTSPLVESHLNPARAALVGRLQWARSSIRKKLDMDEKQERQKPSQPIQPPAEESSDTIVKQTKTAQEEKRKTPSPTPMDLIQLEQPINSVVEEQQQGKTGHVENGSEESGISPSSPLPRSPERMTITHGDPLGALDASKDQPPPSQSSPPRPEETIQTSPRPFVMPDPNARLFTNCRKSSSRSNSSSEAEDDEEVAAIASESEEGSSDSESTTGTDESECDCGHDHHAPSSASRLNFR